MRVTPAMAAGISGHIWSARELLEAREAQEHTNFRLPAALA